MMKKENYLWENDRFRKDPYTVPDGYFAGFEDRMMEQLRQIPVVSHESRRIFKPWMVWAAGIAAIFVVGWFGIRTFYWNPLQENRFQEKIALFVDFFGEELHEGQLAGYFEENQMELSRENSTEINEIIQIDPVLAEEYIYESIGF